MTNEYILILIFGFLTATLSVILGIQSRKYTKLLILYNRDLESFKEIKKELDKLGQEIRMNKKLIDEALNDNNEIKGI